jgi:hypothetical protein
MNINNDHMNWTKLLAKLARVEELIISLLRVEDFHMLF